MPKIVNGKVTYQAGEALPTVGSDAYKQASSGVLPTIPTNVPSPITTPSDKPDLKALALATSNFTRPAQVTNVDQANQMINSGQEKDFNTASKTEDPATRASSTSYSDLFNTIKSGLTSDVARPTTPSLVDTYTGLRNSYGLTDLESQLTSLQKQAKDIQTISQQRTDAEKNKAVPLNVIAGRISEEQSQDNQRLKEVNDQIDTLSSQLKTKYDVVDSIMKYTDADYKTAADDYDKRFAQNITVMNTVNDILDKEKTDEEHAQDDARANLQIIYNNLNSGAVDSSTISTAQRANINKLELQAGLPIGFYESITNKNPKSDILSTTTREDNDKKYADVITRNSDGSLSTQSIYLGGSRSTSSGSSPKFTSTQSNSGAVNAGVSQETFSSYDNDTKNYFINTSQESLKKNINSTIVEPLENGSKTSEEIKTQINDSTLMPGVKNYLKGKVDELSKTVKPKSWFTKVGEFFSQ